MTLEQQFEEIYQNNHLIIWRFCRKNSSHSNQDIDDIVQNTFIKVFRNLNKFKGDRGPIGTWICSIAKNEAIDFYKRKPKNTYALDISDGQQDKLQILLKRQVEQRQIFVKEALDREQQSFDSKIVPIRASIDLLPESQKRVVRLRYLDGLSYREIAAKMGIEPSNARQLAKRGLDLVRSMVGGKKCQILKPPL